MNTNPVKGELCLKDPQAKEGLAEYKTQQGAIAFEWFRTDRAGVFFQFPSPTNWVELCQKPEHAWAKDLRDGIRQDIIGQMVPSTWPNVDTGEDGFHFFDAEHLKKEEEELVAESKRIQAPPLSEYLERFLRKQYNAEGLAVFLVHVDEVVSGDAKTRILDVLRGNRSIVGERLGFGFDTSVPIEAGGDYLVHENEATLRHYLGSVHNWRCRTHVLVSPGQLAEARAFFSAFGT